MSWTAQIKELAFKRTRHKLMRAVESRRPAPLEQLCPLDRAIYSKLPTKPTRAIFVRVLGGQSLEAAIKEIAKLDPQVKTKGEDWLLAQYKKALNSATRKARRELAPSKS